MTTIVKEISVTEVSIDNAKNHSRREYNPGAWSRSIDMYSRFPECKFYASDNDRLYAVYVADGVRFMQEVSYSSCLSGAGFQQGSVVGNTIKLMKYDEGMSIPNTKENRKILATNTKNFKSIFYYN
jgi:hypothetical protein